MLSFGEKVEFSLGFRKCLCSKSTEFVETTGEAETEVAEENEEMTGKCAKLIRRGDFLGIHI